MLFRDLQISLKLLIILLVAVLGIVGADASNLAQLRADPLLDRQAKTRSLVDAAYSLVVHYESLASAGKISKDEAQAARSPPCATCVTTASAVTEQNVARKEIARNVQQAAVGTDQASRSITDVTAAVGETGTAAAQVLSAASELARNAEKLRTEVGVFLTAIRAA